MGSNGKKKTTMAKLNRETRLRERKAEKQGKKEARKQGGGDAELLEEPTQTAPDRFATAEEALAAIETGRR